MPRFRTLAAALAVAMLAALLAACGGASPAAQPTAAPAPAAEPTAAPAPAQPTAAPAPAEPTAAPAAGSGGTLNVGRTAAPDSLNPCVAYLTEAYDLFDLVYDTLIRIDTRAKAVPSLAKEWSVGADGKTWTFKLAEGAKWHDGQPLTSADVAFTFNMIKSIDTCSTIKPNTDLIAAIETPDPQTVVMAFEQPIANTDERFAGTFILPKHIWEQFKDTNAVTEFLNNEMVGSGPFKLVQYKQGEFSQLQAVKDHYLNPPTIDEVIFRVYANADALVQALKTGEADVVSPPSTAVRALQGEATVKVVIGNQRSLTDIFFNVIDPKQCPPDVGKCTGHPALRDVKVRQALAHATDKQALIDTVLLGLGAPGLSLVTPAHGEGYNKTLKDYVFDPEQGKKILEDAGYKDSDGDGIREMPGDPSKPLSLRYSFPSDQLTDGPRFFELLSDMWRQVGVDLQLNALQADALTSVCCPAFDFDVINWGWGASVDPSSLLGVAITDEITTGTSESGYSNPEYDQLFAEQKVTVDRAKRKEILDKLQAILIRDVPYIIPYYRQNVQAYRSDRFTGWIVDPEGTLELINRDSIAILAPVQ